MIKAQINNVNPIEDIDISISEETEKMIEIAREQYKQGCGVRCKTFDDILKHLVSLK